MLSILPLKLLGNQARNVAKNIGHHHDAMHGNNVLSADVFWPPIKEGGRLKIGYTSMGRLNAINVAKAAIKEADNIFQQMILLESNLCKGDFNTNGVEMYIEDDITKMVVADSNTHTKEYLSKKSLDAFGRLQYDRSIIIRRPEGICDIFAMEEYYASDDECKKVYTVIKGANQEMSKSCYYVCSDSRGDITYGENVEFEMYYNNLHVDLIGCKNEITFSPADFPDTQHHIDKFI